MTPRLIKQACGSQLPGASSRTSAQRGISGLGESTEGPAVLPPQPRDSRRAPPDWRNRPTPTAGATQVQGRRDNRATGTACLWVVPVRRLLINLNKYLLKCTVKLEYRRASDSLLGKNTTELTPSWRCEWASHQNP